MFSTKQIRNKLIALDKDCICKAWFLANWTTDWLTPKIYKWLQLLALIPRYNLIQTNLGFSLLQRAAEKQETVILISKYELDTACGTFAVLNLENGYQTEHLIICLLHDYWFILDDYLA